MPWQPTPLLFPDVELVLTAYLRSALAGRPESYAQDVYVSNRVPHPRRDRMVIIRRDGGSGDGLFDAARVSFRVWAGVPLRTGGHGPNEKAATDLSRLVNALLRAAPNGNPIVRVVPQSGPTPVPDDSEQSLRYSVADVYTRAANLA